MRLLKTALGIGILTTRLLVAADTAPAPAAGAAAAKTWNPEQTKVKVLMEELFAASKQAKMEGEVGKSARRKVESALDWDRIGRDCLGKDIASKQSAANLKKFNDLLRDVVVKTAYTRLDTFWKSVKSYDFDSIEIKKDAATVLAKFQVDTETYDLEYFLNKKNSLWSITDISFEGVRYSATIREKLKEFFAEKKSFPALIEKLEKRKQELADEEKKPKPAAK